MQMKAKKLCSHLLERKKNNKGSTIVMVLVIMALLVTLVTIVLSMALMNYRMKATSQKSLTNFYSAETALDEIHLGLTEVVSNAAADAYSVTMEEFTVLDESERKARFKSQYIRNLKTALGVAEVDGLVTYSSDYIEALLKETAYKDADGYGAKLVTQDGKNVVNETDGGLVLKNVTVAYYGQEDYVDEIKTDIVLSVPDINFSQMATMPNLLAYALVAQDSVQINSGAVCNLYGNVYMGTGESLVNNAQLTASSRTDAVANQFLISGGTLKASSNGTITVKDMQLWANDIVIDSSTANIQDTAVYLRDDLVLSNSLYSATGAQTQSSAVISGSYLGYGNVETAQAAGSAVGDATLQKEIEENPADYNSSIVINGVKTTLDISDLDEFKLAGNSYINGTEYADSLDGMVSTANGAGSSITSDVTANMNTADVLMGESISIRTDQIAWLVPADCVAPSMENGGVNPMPITQYAALLNEIEEEYADGQTDFVAQDYLVSLNTASAKLGGATLSELGVTGWQLEAQQVTGTTKSMVYLFLKFDSVSSANAFFRTYYSKQSNLTKLGEYLDLYAIGGINLPQEVLEQSGDTNFYFNGNVLASDAANFYVPDTLSGISETVGEARKEEMVREGMAYQDNYAALNAKLLTDYSHLLTEERQLSVYDNLVNSMISGESTDYTIAEGGKKVFVGTGGQAAIIVNGDFTLNDTQLQVIKTTEDVNGETHTDAECHVLIASGDVKLEKNFEGLIIAGGTITVENRNVTVTANAQKAALALMAEDSTGIYAYDYLKNGETYTISGNEEGSHMAVYSKDSLDMTDYVLYANWTKQ